MELMAWVVLRTVDDDGNFGFKSLFRMRSSGPLSSVRRTRMYGRSVAAIEARAVLDGHCWS